MPARQFVSNASFAAVEPLLSSGRRSFQQFNPAVEKAAHKETKRKVKEEQDRVHAEMVWPIGAPVAVVLPPPF